MPDYRINCFAIMIFGAAFCRWRRPGRPIASKVSPSMATSAADATSDGATGAMSSPRIFNANRSGAAPFPRPYGIHSFFVAKAIA
jgi:hypothetical protein